MSVLFKIGLSFSWNFLAVIVPIDFFKSLNSLILSTKWKIIITNTIALNEKSFYGSNWPDSCAAGLEESQPNIAVTAGINTPKQKINCILFLIVTKLKSRN